MSYFIRTLHRQESSPFDHHFRGAKAPNTPLTSLHVVKPASLERPEILLTLIKAQPLFGRDWTIHLEGEFQSNDTAGFLGSDEGLGVWSRARVTAHLHSLQYPQRTAPSVLAVGSDLPKGTPRTSLRVGQEA